MTGPSALAMTARAVRLESLLAKTQDAKRGYTRHRGRDINRFIKSSSRQNNSWFLADVLQYHELRDTLNGRRDSLL